jgi:hypothetical protein
MILNAIVLGGEVQESTFYDQMTGVQKPSYAVNLTVLDADTKEKYECQMTEGFQSLVQLNDARRHNQPIDVLRQIADQVRAELPPEMAHLTLEVLRFKGKQVSFMKLVCRFAQVAQTV